MEDKISADGMYREHLQSLHNKPTACAWQHLFQEVKTVWNTVAQQNVAYDLI